MAMKPRPQPHPHDVHVGEVSHAEVPSELSKLLARGSTPAPEPSVLDGLLAKPVGGARSGRVICGCGDPRCPWAGRDGYGFIQVEE
jgi:hypothetical protein